MSDFHFSVARITTAQLCRAAGIDRCPPTVLDSLTDILVRHLELLSTTAKESCTSDGRDDVELQDVILAMADKGVLFPDDAPEDASDIEAFLAWLRGPELRRAASVSQHQQQASSALGAAQGAALAAQQASQDPHTAAQAATAAGDDPRDDWLEALVKKQILMGHDKKFKNTRFGESVEDKVVIAGGPASIDEFYQQHQHMSAPATNMTSVEE